VSFICAFVTRAKLRTVVSGTYLKQNFCDIAATICNGTCEHHVKQARNWTHASALLLRANYL
jgi:hypothetical protein